MKTKISLLVFLSLTFMLNAQNNSTSVIDSLEVKSSKDYYDSYDHYINKVSIKFGAGVFIPQGQLQTYFGTAPMFEINANFPFEKGRSVEGVVQFVIPNQQEDFVYLRAIDTIQAKSTFMFNAFLRFKKRIVHTKTSEVNLGVGIGMSTINTDARNPFYSGDDGENKYEFISTFLLMPGIDWCHKFSENAELVFGVDLQYSPYKIEGALREDIGSIALIPKLMYRF